MGGTGAGRNPQAMETGRSAEDTEGHARGKDMEGAPEAGMNLEGNPIRTEARGALLRILRDSGAGRATAEIEKRPGVEGRFLIECRFFCFLLAGTPCNPLVFPFLNSIWKRFFYILKSASGILPFFLRSREWNMRGPGLEGIGFPCAFFLRNCRDTSCKPRGQIRG